MNIDINGREASLADLARLVSAKARDKRDYRAALVTALDPKARTIDLEDGHQIYMTPMQWFLMRGVYLSDELVGHPVQYDAPKGRKKGPRVWFRTVGGTWCAAAKLNKKVGR